MVRDARDPIYHDVQGEAAEGSIIHRFQRWLELQEDDVAQYFCSHGRYVGFGGVFKYKCEKCEPGYED